MMSERAKMLAGQPYNPRDPELTALYRKGRSLLAVYNHMLEAEEDERSFVLAKLFAAIGKHVWIEPPFFCDFGCHISIGDNTFINFNCVFLDCNYITIGADVLIAPAVQIYAVGHTVSPYDRFMPSELAGDGPRYLDKSAPVKVGDKCWIGGGSILLPGVTVGEGSTIGAGSVVNHDVPPYVLAAGNPCRIIRELKSP